jgi:methylated-DNA-protein-cysteine methyltransferase-like protein
MLSRGAKPRRRNPARQADLLKPDAGAATPGRWERVYAVVRRIPRGRVATYGQVAELAGLGGHARQVGYALHALPAGSLVPWHRVLNARGLISLRPGSGDEVTQRLLLEREGVKFDGAGRADLKLFGWRRARR